MWSIQRSNLRRAVAGVIFLAIICFPTKIRGKYLDSSKPQPETIIKSDRPKDPTVVQCDDESEALDIPIQLKEFQ